MSLSAIVSIATSALQANARRVETVASNIANLRTEDYEPRDVRTVSLGGGAVSGGVATIIVEDGEADPADQFVRLIQARTAYSLAAETLSVADELARETTDIVS